MQSVERKMNFQQLGDALVWINAFKARFESQMKTDVPVDGTTATTCIENSKNYAIQIGPNFTGILFGVP